MAQQQQQQQQLGVQGGQVDAQVPLVPMSGAGGELAVDAGMTQLQQQQQQLQESAGYAADGDTNGSRIDAGSPAAGADSLV
jgi:hypothetical protein